MADAHTTKQILADEMKSLMARKSFAKITVGELCEACGMNRKSFYYHFLDKYDCVNWIFQNEFLDRISPKEYADRWDLMVDLCTYLDSERSFYREALTVTGQNSLREYLAQNLQPRLVVSLSGVLKEEENKAFYSSFLADAFVAAVIRWIAEDHLPLPDFLANMRSILLKWAHEVITDLEEDPT
ncbi:hypothetical protein ABB02_00646 [Clostridiaceae bacterium JG1575]|nr:hypothetical protein ABB02_00646 [Clostridiaceae bacterium JG1575]